MMKRGMGIILLSLVLVLLTACSYGEESWSMQGEISGLQKDYLHDRIIGSIVVEEEGNSKNYGRASVRLTKNTLLIDENDNQISIEALAVGQRVALRFTGAVAESSPVQAVAKKLQILK